MSWCFLIQERKALHAKLKINYFKMRRRVMDTSTSPVIPWTQGQMGCVKRPHMPALVLGRLTRGHFACKFTISLLFGFFFKINENSSQSSLCPLFLGQIGSSVWDRPDLPSHPGESAPLQAEGYFKEWSLEETLSPTHQNHGIYLTKLILPPTHATALFQTLLQVSIPTHCSFVRKPFHSLKKSQIRCTLIFFKMLYVSQDKEQRFLVPLFLQIPWSHKVLSSVMACSFTVLEETWLLSHILPGIALG